MIVVDTNTIAYLYLSTDHTHDVEQLLNKDADWIAPSLWKSEFRNILALYLRREIIDLDTAFQIQQKAESLLLNSEYEVNSTSVLTLANSSGCTAYDCEFISLAKSLSVKLVTADKKLIKAFPDVALNAKSYLAAYL